MSYLPLIQSELGCTCEEAERIKHIMREDVFHSTLDWQSEAELRRGAREAWQLWEENREAYLEFERGLQVLADEMKGAR